MGWLTTEVAILAPQLCCCSQGAPKGLVFPEPRESILCSGLRAPIPRPLGRLCLGCSIP